MELSKTLKGVKMTYEEKYKRWAEKLKSLDNHIRGLKNWDDYAVSCQNEYDWLLKQKPTKEDVEEKKEKR